MDPSSLSTTSYSILGYLAVRPWSAYELAKQMGRTFHHVWPRAESGIYREVKRLVDAGLATAEEERTGKRARSVYDITDAGRAALREWLAVPHSDGFLESEGLVRVLFADHGTKDDLKATIRAMADDARSREEVFLQLLRQYRAGTGQFMARAHINLVFAKFVLDFAGMVDRWAEWSEAFVDTWPEIQEHEPDEATLQAFDDAIAEVMARR